MPKPQEVCTVVAFGEQYSNWKTIEVTRTLDSPVVNHAMLSVAEISSNATSLSSIKLKPGDPVQVLLGGQLALNGFVYMRQGAADGAQHGVQVGIVSNSQDVLASTVDADPGQYTKQTVQQIGSAVFGKVGVPFTVIGNPPGADLKFDRVSEHLGERRFDFIARLCNMRNLHMMDTLNGIVAFRGPDTEGGSFGDSAFELREGYNMLRGRVLLQTWEQVDKLITDGQDHGNDSADANRGTQGVARIPGRNRPLRFAAEEAGPDAAMQMRANQEKDYVELSMVDGDITVPGWFAPSGQLWMNYVRSLINLHSPLLLPQNDMKFMIKGVVHRQSDAGGTTTDVLLCDTLGVGGNATEPVFLNSPEAQALADGTAPL